MHEWGGPKLRSVIHGCGAAMIRLAFALRPLVHVLISGLQQAFQDHPIGSIVDSSTPYNCSIWEAPSYVCNLYKALNGALHDEHGIAMSDVQGKPLQTLPSLYKLPLPPRFQR
eukprot:3779376-Karenia_brevis.AAC.1